MGAPKIDLEKLSAEERIAVEARRAYKRAWRAKNKERVKDYERRFWAKQAERQQAAKKSDIGEN